MESEGADSSTDRRIADNLKVAREQAGLTQKELAERMQAAGWRTFHQQTIGRYEGGQRDLTTGEVEALAAELGTDLFALMRAGALVREQGNLLAALRTLNEATRQVAAMQRRQSNARARVEQLIKEARDKGHAAELAAEIASAEYVLGRRSDERYPQGQRRVLDQ